jgi:hypothetical protein
MQLTKDRNLHTKKHLCNAARSTSSQILEGAQSSSALFHILKSLRLHLGVQLTRVDLIRLAATGAVYLPQDGSARRRRTRTLFRRTGESLKGFKRSSLLLSGRNGGISAIQISVSDSADAPTHVTSCAGNSLEPVFRLPVCNRVSSGNLIPRETLRLS